MPRSKKQSLIGNGMNANLLKEFIDFSYKGNTSVAPEGYSIDAPLSDSRVKVYTKNGSNDKNVVVTHRGSVGLDDWLDNASYLFKGKVVGTKTYNLHRERHKKAVDKYGAKNIIAIGHSRAGLYIQELNKEFPMKEIISYNKASGFFDIGKTNAENQTDVRVGNDVVSLLAPLQKNPNAIVKIDGTKNPLDFNTAHQSSQLDKLGTTFIGKKDDPSEGRVQLFQMTEPDVSIDKSTIGKGFLNTLANADLNKIKADFIESQNKKKLGEGIQPRISGATQIRKLLGVELRRLERMRNGTTEYKSKYITESKTLDRINRLKLRLASAEANEGQASEEFFVPKTEKWLKINKNETYLNTPLKEDGRHQLMLSEIDKRIALAKAKKAEAKEKRKEKTAAAALQHNQTLYKTKLAKQAEKQAAKQAPIEPPKIETPIDKPKIETPIDKPKPEKITISINKVITDEINKAKDAFAKQTKEDNKLQQKLEKEQIKQQKKLSKEEIIQQKKLAKEQKKKAKLKQKQEYDKLRYLKQKASKLGTEAKAQEKSEPTEKQVEKLEEKVEHYKEEVGDFLNDIAAYEQLEEGLDLSDKDDFEIYMKRQDEYFNKHATEEQKHERKYRNQEFTTFKDKKVRYVEPYENDYRAVLTNDVYGIRPDGVKRIGYIRIRKDKPKFFPTIEGDPLRDTRTELNIRFLRIDSKEDKNIDTMNKLQEEAENKKTGKGFNKKQLKQIILDKNKVIADLEETAYGGVLRRRPEEDINEQNLKNLKEKLTKLEKEITDIKQTIEYLKSQLESVTDDLDDLAEIDSSEHTDLMRTYKELLDHIDAETEEIERLTNEKKTILKLIQDEEYEEEDTIVGGYMDYNTNYLDNILDSNSTPQNILIHSFKSKTKYIQSLVE